MLLFGPAFGAGLSGLLGFFGSGPASGSFASSGVSTKTASLSMNLSTLSSKFSFPFLLHDGAVPVFTLDLRQVHAVGGGDIPENLLLFFGIERDSFGFRYFVEHELGSDVLFRLQLRACPVFAANPGCRRQTGVPGSRTGASGSGASCRLPARSLWAKFQNEPAQGFFEGSDRARFERPFALPAPGVFSRNSSLSASRVSNWPEPRD